MNFNEKRKVMFGENAVIEMDIDPAVSNLDTPTDLKVPIFSMNNNRTTFNNQKEIAKLIKIDAERSSSDCENDGVIENSQPTKPRQ